MTPATLLRPTAADVASYYFGYIDLVPDGDVLEILAAELPETRRLLAGVDARRETYRYAPGKWSVREVIGHLIDAERVFGYRALHMARGSAGSLPSMDQEVWAAAAGAHERPLADLLAELEHVRGGHLALFRSFDAAAWERVGVASDVSFRVRVFPFILAGHERHHRSVLVEKYLS